MADMIADAMDRAPITTAWGKLTAADGELNGDFLQVRVRLSTMTGDPRSLASARGIADAYIEEVLPGNFGVPSTTWDFAAHTGEPQLRRRDHGNELVVGLTLLYALESDLQSVHAARYGAAVKTMLDRSWRRPTPTACYRTLLLYALMNSQGVMPAEKAQFDAARHRRVINLARNYVRLNECPEWFVVEPNWLYRIGCGTRPARIRLGAELMQGERLAAGDWTIQPIGPPPYGRTPITPD